MLLSNNRLRLRRVCDCHGMRRPVPAKISRDNPRHECFVRIVNAAVEILQQESKMVLLLYIAAVLCLS